MHSPVPRLVAPMPSRPATPPEAAIPASAAATTPAQTWLSPLRTVAGWLRKPSALVWSVVGASLAIPLFFVLFTHLAWEDFFITYRFSENLVHGRGLVYWPGERVYGFTSPLNTLLPALFAWVTGAADFVVPLWLFRFTSLAGLAVATATMAWLLTREHATSRTAHALGLLFPVIALLEVKTTAFAMSGQEAGLVLAFLAPAFALAATGRWPAHPLLGGLLAAGLLYTRPDAFIYLGAVAVAGYLFAPGGRRQLALALLKSGLVCALAYLPWLLFTWGYYGSPVPHTVLAKYGVEGYASSAYGLTAPLVAGLVKSPFVLCWALSPVYDWQLSGPGTWPVWIHDVTILLELVAVLYWLLPTRDRLGRAASLVAFIIFGYLVYAATVAQFAPWYYPPLAFMSLAALVSAAATLARRVRHGAMARILAVGAAAGLLGFLGFLFTASLRPLRFKQEAIEWNHRRLVGLWLKDHAAPAETVYLEPLGYIGYFSQRHMLDWPGLVSPEVVAARQQLPFKSGYTWMETAEVLLPDWIVARPTEADAIRHSKVLAPQYELVKTFDASDQIRPVDRLPGIQMVFGEAAFEIFHRKRLAGPP